MIKTMLKEAKARIVIMVILLGAACFLTYYFHAVLETGTVFTHFFYIPIILASLWWKRKGLFVAIFLSVVLILSHNIIRPDALTINDYLRSLMFIVVSIVTVMLCERIAKAKEELLMFNKELEEKTKEIGQANIRLKELDQLKSMFIASMSHELRTPLNSIIGFTGIILQGMAGEVTEEQRKQLTMVKNSANHLLALINDIIDVSKIEAGKVELAIEEFDLSTLMQEVKDSFAVAIAEKGLKTSLEVPKELLIKSDERRVKQIIVNLVSNAVKFTEKGEIEIRAAKKDERVEVSVRDTGIGMRKEDIDKLFKAFSRILTEGELKEGTGLGLYLSKKIANLLGGEIKAESEFGKGSEFTFTVPLKPSTF